MGLAETVGVYVGEGVVHAFVEGDDEVSGWLVVCEFVHEWDRKSSYDFTKMAVRSHGFHSESLRL
jgi:hypothetical protein